LSGRQKKQLACKEFSDEMLLWHLCGATCKWFAYGPTDATATASSLASLKRRMVMVQPFWCQLTQDVLEKEAIKWVSVCLSCMMVATVIAIFSEPKTHWHRLFYSCAFSPKLLVLFTSYFSH